MPKHNLTYSDKGKQLNIPGCIKHDGNYYHLDPKLLDTSFKIRDVRPEVVKDLKESIKAIGVKEPIKIRLVNVDTNANGKLIKSENTIIQVVGGQHRVQACLQLIEEGIQIKSINGVLTKGSDDEALCTALRDNQGTPLQPVEKANLFKKLQNRGWSAKEISKQTGLSYPSVNQYLNLLLNASNEAIQSLEKDDDGLKLTVNEVKEIVEHAGVDSEKQKELIDKKKELKKNLGNKKPRLKLKLEKSRSIFDKMTETVKKLKTLDQQDEIKQAYLEGQISVYENVFGIEPGRYEEFLSERGIYINIKSDEKEINESVNLEIFEPEEEIDMSDDGYEIKYSTDDSYQNYDLEYETELVDVPTFN